jgi:hypothetical protein
MAQQTVNTGTVGNDGLGDDLRTGATKINANFTEIYSNITALSLQLNLASVNSNGIGFGGDGILFDGATKDSFTTVTRLVPEDPTQINVVTIPDSTGTLSLISDIKNVADRDYVLGIRGLGTALLDSATAIQTMFARGFLDSARMVRISLDSADVTAYIDSDYVQQRQAGGLDSARALNLFLTPIQIDSNIDSNFARDIASRDVRLDNLDSSLTLITNFKTDNIPEDSALSNGGSGPGNLYFTTTRANTAIDNRVDINFINNLNVDAETLGGQTLANIQADYQDATEVQTIINNNFDAVSRDFVPATDETYDLGTATKKWKDLHLSGTTIFLGGGELKFENSEFRFGGGTLGINDAVVLDPTQRLFFDSAAGAPNITKSDAVQPNGLVISANALSLRTVDDVSADWFVRTNTPAGGTMSRFGEGGLVMLPHNTDTERTQYHTNAFYNTTYRKGAMHYNTDQNKFEFADSDGWYAIDRAAVASAAVNAQYLQFGLNGTVSGASSAVDLVGANGASMLSGVVMPVAGTILRITMSSNAAAHSSGSLTHQINIYKNGSSIATPSVEVTSTGEITLNAALSIAFAAGDRLKIAVDNDTGLDTEDHNVIVRFVES